MDSVGVAKPQLELLKIGGDERLGTIEAAHSTGCLNPDLMRLQLASIRVECGHRIVMHMKSDVHSKYL